MSTFRLSLRALSHPLSLLAIGALLLNDHWLKIYAPSALTGKLSDFAGLFFFPFLLAAVLMWPLRNWSSRRVMALALSLTAIWFTAVKTLPPANALTVAALEALLYMPVQIVLDPTDCAALVMLFPAWQLWARLERAQYEPPGKWAYLTLGLAALATMATSVPPPPPEVVRLAQADEIVYARRDQRYTEDSEYVLSTDGGLTWASTETVLTVISETLHTEVVYSVSGCVPTDELRCYRLPDATRVEASTDGGQSWQKAWEIPWGRLAYMQRARQWG